MSGSKCIFIRSGFNEVHGELVEKSTFINYIEDEQKFNNLEDALEAENLPLLVVN